MMSTIEPLMLENGWTFAEPDPLTGARYMYNVYQRATPLYTGMATVPILWDKQTGTIVSNESSEILPDAGARRHLRGVSQQGRPAGATASP